MAEILRRQSPATLYDAIDGAVAEVGCVLLGKEQQIRLALCCLLARGHLLLEDLPGMGKTTLSHALASVLGLEYRRVQFTSDLLPADILGVSIFERRTESFSFHPGPIFSQVLLADEINRSSPRTQSALLEAMAEGQVTVEGETRALPEPFFVIATQNPIHQAGTYPLPESQLDRFLMRLELGYPDPRAERELLRQVTGTGPGNLTVGRRIDREGLLAIRELVQAVHVSDAVLDYVQRLVAHSRQSPLFQVGLSPRGALSLVNAARTWAVTMHRSHVLPDDIQAVLPAVTTHRLVPAAGADADGALLAQTLLREVDVLGV